MSPERKVALVTGGAQGIGRAIAVRLLQEGMAVAILDQNPAKGKQVQQELEALGMVAFEQAVLAREDEVRSAIQTVTGRFGRLDALINNAGIMIRAPLSELSLEQWDRVFGSTCLMRSSAPSSSPTCCAAQAARSSTSPRLGL